MSGLLKESNPWAPDLDISVDIVEGATIDVKPQAFIDSNEPAIVVIQQPAKGTVTPGGDAPGLLIANLSQEGPDEARYTLTTTQGFVSAPAILRLTGVSQAPDPGPDPGETLVDNPFNAASAYHIPLGSNAILGGPGNPIVDWWTSNINSSTVGGALFINWRGRDGLRDIISSESDPLRTVVQADYDGNAVPASEPWDLNFPIRIPISSDIPIGPLPTAERGDNVVAIYTSLTQCVEFYRMWRHSDGTYYARISRVVDLAGIGHPTALGQRVGVSASGWTIIGGAFSAAELAAGEPQHAFTFALSGATSGAWGSNMGLSRQIRWPAGNADWFAALSQNNNGPVPYGQAFALPFGLNVASLGLTTQEAVNFANCLRKYPIYCVDDSFGWIMRANDIPANRSAILADIRKIAPALRPVLNWQVGGTAQMNIGGGQSGAIGSAGDAYTGTPRGPNTAFDA